MSPSAPYQLPRTPDAWHQVVAPGGYEWWYFDAEDPATDTQVVAIFLQGFIFHPQYLRRYFAHLRKPARRPAPLPAEYPCAYFAVYQHGKVLAQFMTQYPPATFTASTERPEVTIGPNHMGREEGGAYSLHLEGTPWQLTWRGPQRPEGGSLSADLTFTPCWHHAPHERTFLSRQMSGAEHQWIIAAPLCDVVGSVQFTPAAGQGEQRIAFTGRGYHDHNYGTGPIGPGLRRWTWGRALLKNRAVIFHVALPADSALPAETHLLHADQDDIRAATPADLQITYTSDLWRRIKYPRTLRGGGLTLSDPRIVEASPFYLRLTYAAEFEGVGGQAFCEVAYPHRLRWPILGRMIEMSIHKES